MSRSAADHEFPTPRQTRIGVLLSVPLATLAVGSLASAGYTPNAANFGPGNKLTSAALTAELQNIATAIGEVGTPSAPFSERAIVKYPSANNETYSLGATFKGYSPIPTAGAFSFSGATGYRAAKLICAAALSSASAHMCSGEEIVRTIQLGGTLPKLPGGPNPNMNAAWIASGTWAYVGTDYIDDCGGYQTNTPSKRGMGATTADETALNTISSYHCNELAPIACCD